MLPSTDVFVAGLTFYARRRGLPAHYDVVAIDGALAEAERLAAGRERDEPAALFYACARRSRAFSGAAEHLLSLAARRHAASMGLELALDDVVFAILHARILYGAITWDELRADFEAKLGPRR
jgi:hypothetical protein